MRFHIICSDMVRDQPIWRDVHLAQNGTPAEKEGFLVVLPPNDRWCN